MSSSFKIIDIIQKILSGNSKKLLFANSYSMIYSYVCNNRVNGYFHLKIEIFNYVDTLIFLEEDYLKDLNNVFFLFNTNFKINLGQIIFNRYYKIQEERIVSIKESLNNILIDDLSEIVISYVN